MQIWKKAALCLALGSLCACSLEKIPQRNVDFDNLRQVVKSYRDYRHLEQAGVETVDIQTRFYEQQVSIQLYLFTIAQAFEKFGREKDAKKVYLHLLTQYPVLYDGGQLGVMAENRLRWILADKSWIKASLDELILSLEKSLQRRDFPALQRLISRDFGLGRNESERFAVRFPEGMELLGKDLENLRHPLVEIVSKSENERVVLKTSGWDHGSKIWYFTLHKNERKHGWECDLAYWEKEHERTR